MDKLTDRSDTGMFDMVRQENKILFRVLTNLSPDVCPAVAVTVDKKPNL